MITQIIIIIALGLLALACFAAALAFVCAIIIVAAIALHDNPTWETQTEGDKVHRVGLKARTSATSPSNPSTHPKDPV